MAKAIDWLMLNAIPVRIGKNTLRNPCAPRADALPIFTVCWEGKCPDCGEWNDFQEPVILGVN